MENSNNKPLINILTRTSNRPIGFKNCTNSVKAQTYSNIRHIICTDDKKSISYIGEYTDDYVLVDKNKIVSKDRSTNPGRGKYSPHNLYCNILKEKVNEGWIMYLDDDDHLIDECVIDNIVNNIVDEDTILVWKMKFPNGMVLPTKNEYRDKKPRLYKIGSPCFLFHSKWKDKANWDSWKCADFRFVDKLFKSIPKSEWIDRINVKINNLGDFGNRNDIDPKLGFLGNKKMKVKI